MESPRATMGQCSERVPGVAEGAVAHQFGIEAAVVGVVDLFGHEAVERGADLRGGVIHLNGERRRLGKQAQRQGEDGEEGGNCGGLVHDPAIVMRARGV